MRQHPLPLHLSAFILHLSLSTVVFAAPPTTLPPDILPPTAKLETLATNLHFTEGPTWITTGLDAPYLLFSDIPTSTLHKWSPKTGLSTFRHPSHQTNGNTTDRQGRLISCQHQSRTLTRTESDGTLTTLADSYNGKRLNSPNDAVVKSDGTIWFTDPTYGIKPHEKEQPHNHVFRLNPETKQLTAVATDFDQPNGICFSPDERTLYVADSGKPHHIRSFTVTKDNTLTDGKVFATISPGLPDGIRCDAAGRLWSSAGDGAQVFSPAGTPLGRIPTPSPAANLTFGGPTGQTLFLTAQSSLHSIQTNTTGATK
jgi:gluconolactonase